MRSSSTSVKTNVPAFLSKLWTIVNDPNTNHMIRWSPGGHSFVIQNETRFRYTLLPIYYGHKNMSSFIRQLNMYGFHKVSSKRGEMNYDKDEIEFFHPHFHQGKHSLMKHIKRKISTAKNAEENKTNNVGQISEVLTDLKQLRGRQESVDNQLASMKEENAVLWMELVLLRQKHIKQQQIVNKLINFLATLVLPTLSGLGGLRVKRRYPLMINAVKYSKIAKTDSNSNGTTIHELDSESNTAKSNNNQIEVESPLVEKSSGSYVFPDIPVENADFLHSDILPDSDPILEEAELIIPDKIENQLEDTVLSVDSDTDNFPIKDIDVPLVITDKDIFQVVEKIFKDKLAINKEADTTEEGIFEERKSQAAYSNAMVNNEKGPIYKEKDTAKEPILEERKFQAFNSNAMINNEKVATTKEADTAEKRILEERKFQELNSNAMTSNENIESFNNSQIKKKDKRKSLTVNSKSVADISNLKVSTADELDNHPEDTQSELDSIKDMLLQGYFFDANAVLGNSSDPVDAVSLPSFNPDKGFLLDIPSLTKSAENKNENCDSLMSGSELPTYVNQSFVLDFDSLLEESANGLWNNEPMIEAPPDDVDDQISIPVIIKNNRLIP